MINPSTVYKWAVDLL